MPTKENIIKWAKARKRSLGKPMCEDDLRDSCADITEIITESNKQGEHDALDALIEFLK